MEDKTPKVSVIIAAYNVEKYIAQCLESIINQTLKDIEIICVNDGSNDRTLEILNEYAKKDKRVIVINQKQKGPGGARNSALDVARGEYLIIQDSDDWRELDCLEKLYNAAVENNLDTVVGDAYFVSENGTYFKNFINELPFSKVIDSKKIPKGIAYQWQFLYKREPVKNIRYIENVDYEDGVYFSEIWMNLKNTMHVKDAINYYRQVPTSSCRGRNDKIFTIYKTLDYFKSLLPKYKKYEKYYILERNYKDYVNFLISKIFARAPFNTAIATYLKCYFKLLKHLTPPPSGFVWI